MRLYAFIFLSLAACTPAESPPVEPPTTTIPAETTSTVPVEPPPPSPEPPGRAPEDYFSLATIQNVVDDLTADLQTNAWAGWRDTLYVAAFCSWALEPAPDALFALTHNEMQAFALLGMELDGEGVGFVSRLPAVNKRCAPAHPEHSQRFCGRSDVLRARLSEFRARLEEHLASASEMRDGLRGQPGYGSEFNSIKGFCSYANANR